MNLPGVCLISLAKDKFEVCCVPEETSHHACWRDAKEEVVAELKDGSAYYLPVCDNPKHLALVKEAQRKLTNGISLENLSKYVVKTQVFVKPAEILDKKCKVIQWENFKKRKLELPPQAEDTAQKQPKQSKQIKKTYQEILPEIKKPSVVHTACKDWEWVDDIGIWMDVTGNMASVSKLSDKELKHTILAIKDANFKCISPKISWVKLVVINDDERFVFPDGSLNVGAKVAAEKLEDFRIECRRRGYI